MDQPTFWVPIATTLLGILLGSVSTYFIQQRNLRTTQSFQTRTTILAERITTFKEFSKAAQDRSLNVTKVIVDLGRNVAPEVRYYAELHDLLNKSTPIIAAGILPNAVPNILYLAEALFGPRTREAIDRAKSTGHINLRPGQAPIDPLQVEFERRLLEIRQIPPQMEHERKPVAAAQNAVREMFHEMLRFWTTQNGLDVGNILGAMQQEMWLGLEQLRPADLRDPSNE